MDADDVMILVSMILIISEILKSPLHLVTLISSILNHAVKVRDHSNTLNMPLEGLCV